MVRSQKNELRTSLRSATHATDSTWSGCQAKSAATKALRQRAPVMALDPLAAALAEAGRFKEAVDVANTACKLARSKNNTRLEMQISSRRELYILELPYRAPK
jgi:hypothetical protein